MTTGHPSFGEIPIHPVTKCQMDSTELGCRAYRKTVPSAHDLGPTKRDDPGYLREISDRFTRLCSDILLSSSIAS